MFNIRRRRLCKTRLHSPLNDTNTAVNLDRTRPGPTKIVHNPHLMSISIVDWTIIVVYLVGVVGLGCWAGINAKKQGQRHGESVAGDYFMAAHTLKWPVIGLALFATNISCVHLVSLAQSGYDTGLLIGNFEWMAAFTLILLGFFFAPFYSESKVATLPDFLEKRYCRECRDWLAFVSIIAAIIFHIAFPLATGWLVLHDIFGIEKWTCIILMCGLTAIYTVRRRPRRRGVTETIQAIVLIIGAVRDHLVRLAERSAAGAACRHPGRRLRRRPGPRRWQTHEMLRPHGVDRGLPWYAIFLGYPVLGIWYCARTRPSSSACSARKDENHARLGPLFCAPIKILPVFIFILPGLHVVHRHQTRPSSTASPRPA